jgi:hypothetical protein
LTKRLGTKKLTNSGFSLAVVEVEGVVIVEVRLDGVEIELKPIYDTSKPVQTK